MIALLERFLTHYDFTELKNLALKPITNTRGEAVGELRIVEHSEW
jgi:hypothetical protein